jgi:AraC-like DNA-binding protein
MQRFSGIKAIRYAVSAMTHPLISPQQAQSADGPFLIAVEKTGEDVRVTPSHNHARGQLLGALHGLLSVGVDNQQWVVPAIHAVWIPPHRTHALRSHGAYSGWNVYIEEAACAPLPAEPCTVRISALLREAVRRAASWHSAVLDAAQLRVAGVILDEIQSLPRERLGLPMPQDTRLQRIAHALTHDLADNRRMQQWAEWAAISPRTLSRRFVDETGFSFAEWRQQARLLRALEMLAADAPVTTVALELGYDNVSAFIAMFKRAMGTTPSRYFHSYAADAAPVAAFTTAEGDPA